MTNTNSLSASFAPQGHKLNPARFFIKDGRIFIEVSQGLGLEAKYNTFIRHMVESDQSRWPDDWAYFLKLYPEAETLKKPTVKDIFAELENSTEEDKKRKLALEKRKAEHIAQIERDKALPIASKRNQEPLKNGQVPPPAYDHQTALINSRSAMRNDPPVKRILMGGDILGESNK